MSFWQSYKNKLSSAEHAVSLVKTGDRVEYGHFLCSPIRLDSELAKRAHDLKGIHVQSAGFTTYSQVVKTDPDCLHFKYNSTFFSAYDRELSKKGHNLNFTPMIYHELPTYYDRYYLPDICMLRTTVMDAHGYFNFGACNDVLKTIIDHSRKIVVEVNENMPYCLGGNNESIHISKVDKIVEAHDTPIYNVPQVEANENEKKIAEFIVNEIPNGACIQLGIGGIPNAIGKLIKDSDLKNLGVHTEMMVDAYLEMYEAGKITNAQKTIDKGKMTYSFIGGSDILYKFIDKNPLFASYPIQYTNGPANVSSNSKTVSINSALEVDLFGQISSESIGSQQISGTGGQLDFHYGAYNSVEGKSFICLQSVRKDSNGNLRSCIKPYFDPGTVVSVPRSMSHYIVTEFGVAMLKGKSVWERAKSLIAIAHPDFREALSKKAHEMRMLPK
jgi:acyl-CoA hydrolase